MKRSLFLILFFFLFPSILFSQLSKDNYYFRFLSAYDSLPVPFLVVKGLKGDSLANKWACGLDCVFTIPEDQLIPEMKLSVQAPEHQRFDFYPRQLALNDTIDFKLKKGPIYLDEIIISGYYPKIDPGRPENTKLKTGKGFSTHPIYTANQYAILDSLKSGKWFKNQTTVFAGEWYQIAKYLQTEIEYPEFAREKRIEDNIFFIFSIDRKGNIQSRRIVKATDPLLALTASKVFDKISRILPAEFNRTTQTNEFVFPEVEFVFAIKFKLK